MSSGGIQEIKWEFLGLKLLSDAYQVTIEDSLPFGKPRRLIGKA